MNLQTLTLDPLLSLRVAILGYGNQGRAHALNLRDSKVDVCVGARPGKSWDLALADGFTPCSYAEAAGRADILMLLLSDPVIGEIYGAIRELLTPGKAVGFAHGFAYHYGQLEPLAECAHFLVSPKGAGAILRKNFEKGGGLPGVYALGKNATEEWKPRVLAYAKAIGVASSVLIETSFKEETECDLFGEQAVLCGGILKLMEGAFDTLVEQGMKPDMAFFESCYEAKLILDLWVAHGPRGMADRISPTAFYGGTTRGRRLVTADVKREMGRIFQEIRRGDFAKEWMSEVRRGMPTLKEESNRLAESGLEEAYQALKEQGLTPES